MSKKLSADVPRQGSALAREIRAVEDTLRTEPEIAAGQATAPRGDALRPAAVLVPLVTRPAGLQVLLTRRTDHLHDHAGQISFPGGRLEAHDGSLLDTALRETHEEIGLTAAHIRIAGRLADYITVTGYQVTPAVGFVNPPFDLRLDPFEVAEAFEVPLAFFREPANLETHRLMRDGRQRYYHVFRYGDRYIWGATAGMLVDFCRRLAHRQARR